MGRFMIAHLQKGSFGSKRILEEATAKQMHGTAMTFLPPLNRMLLGFYETNINGHRSISHAGDTQWFHSDLSLFVDDGVGLYISMNSSGGEAAAHKVRAALFHGFADRYLPGPGRTTARSTRTPRNCTHSRWPAVYENSRRSDDSFISIVNLVGQTKVVVTEEGSIIGACSDWRGWPAGQVDRGCAVRVARCQWLRSPGRQGRRRARRALELRARFPVHGLRARAVVEVGSWLMLAVGAGLVALLLTVLAWPVSALVRRHYKVSYQLTGRDARAHRLSPDRLAGRLLRPSSASFGVIAIDVQRTRSARAGQ